MLIAYQAKLLESKKCKNEKMGENGKRQIMTNGVIQ
jgi:hypothetical protein